MTTLTDLTNLSADFDNEKVDYASNKARIHFFGCENGTFLHIAEQSVTVPYYITQNALRQVCERLAPEVMGRGSRQRLPFEFIQRAANDGALAVPLADMLNILLGRYTKPRKPFIVRTYQNHARAFLSDTYTPVSNTELLKVAQDALALLKPTDTNIIRPFVSPDHLGLRVIVTDVAAERDVYGLGFFIGNSEIGDGSVSVVPLIQRHACTNSIIVSIEEEGYLKAMHRGLQQMLADRVALAIGNTVKLSGELLRKLLDARAVEIPNLTDVINALAEKEGWSLPLKHHILMGTENDHSLFGLINGVTYAAHTYYNDSPRDQIALEQFGGRLLLQGGSYGAVDR